ncbi:hypothetical protein PG988_005709 [Apiospora saccharicola]
MLRTSQDSRAVAQRVLESSHSVLLRPESKASLDRGGLPTLRVRPMVDLVILNAGWPDQLDMRRRIISYRQVQDVPQLRCLGVPCTSMASDISTGRPTLDTEWFGKFVNVIKGLRTVYWGLRVLYITVEPEQLRASVGPQWPETQRGFQSDFLDAYEKGPPPARFYDRGGAREYFELAASQVAEHGGWLTWSLCSRRCATGTSATGPPPTTTRMRKSSGALPTRSRSPCTFVSSRGERGQVGIKGHYKQHCNL